DLMNVFGRRRFLWPPPVEIVFVWLTPVRRRPFVWELMLFIAAWPWLPALALMVYAQSMGRAKVRRIHALRCAAYSFDIVLWMTIGAATIAALGVSQALDGLQQAQCTAVLILVTWAMATYRLWRAYQLYMRFDH